MNNFVVYRSSAGSGKTFTLVKEYLRLALYDDKKLAYNYKRILAITFTNKAAAEMKNRVLAALNDISRCENELPLIGKLLCRELNLDKENLKTRAEIVLKNILHHYSDFAIGTIDSFTHKIVKTFAHDLKLPVNFNVELDTRGFYDKVIALLMNKVGEDEYVSRLLKDFVLNKAENNSSWDPEKQIREFSSLLLKENSEAYIHRLKAFNTAELEVFRKQFRDYTAYYQSQLKTTAQKALALIQDSGLSDDDFKYKKTGAQNFFKKCFNNTVGLDDSSSSRLTEAISTAKWSGHANPALEKISPQLSNLAAELVTFIKDNHEYYSLCDLLANQMYSLMLLKKIEEISLEQKQEDRLVFISEFNQRIFDIINNEPTPFIYERLGERYNHYLLDEFQDTSSLQWQNILPLVDNSLSGGWFNLIVGDGKQSIYRWRNANVKQFSDLPRIENTTQSQSISEREKSLHRNYEEQFLDTNYRSLEQVVEFNNKLFGYLKENILSENNQAIYNQHAQKSKTENQKAGFVSVDLTKTEPDNLDDYTCQQIVQHIRNALSSGFEYGDICILARRNFHGNLIANYLTDLKIPVVSSDSLLLKNNLEVNTLLSFLNYQVNNQDVISAAAVLNYLRITSVINQSQFHQYLEKLSGNTNLFKILEWCGVKLQAEELLLSNLLDNCIVIVKALNLNKKAFHYIRFFLDEVNEYLVTKNSNISSFFDWWQIRSQNASLVIPDSSNAVQIMTIHASKGLEFPVVIVPYCNWAVYKAGDNWVNVHHEKVDLPVTVVSLSKKASDSGFEKELEAEQNEQLLDNLNLLYVAFTRAVERLHVLANQATTNRQKTVSGWLENFVKTNTETQHENTYEYGVLEPKAEIKKTAELNPYELQSLYFESSKNAVKLKAAYLNNTPENEHAKKQGIVLHWLLSKIKTKSDVQSAFEQGLLNGIINHSELPELVTKIESLLNHKATSVFFEEGLNSKLEAEIITSEGVLLRPDRLIFKEDCCLIVDYKTGLRNDKKYLKQLLQYEDALRAMGISTIKKHLLYVDELEVVELI